MPLSREEQGRAEHGGTGSWYRIHSIPCYKSDSGLRTRDWSGVGCEGTARETLDLAREMSLTARVHATISNDLVIGSALTAGIDPGRPQCLYFKVLTCMTTLDIPVSGFSSTLDTGSPAYSPCSRTSSSVRLGFGFSQPR